MIKSTSMTYTIHRLFAHAIDSFVVSVLLIIPSYFWLTAIAKYPATGYLFTILYVVSLISLPIFKTLTTYFWNGQTSGKDWVNLRVVGHKGSKLSFLECFFREFLRAFLYLGSAFIMVIVDLLLIAWRSDKRTVTDLITGTRVIYLKDSVDLSKDGYQGLFAWWKYHTSRVWWAFSIFGLVCILAAPVIMISPTIDYYYRNTFHEECYYVQPDYNPMISLFGPSILSSNNLRITAISYSWGELKLQVLIEKNLQLAREDELVLKQRFWFDWGVVEWKNVSGCERD